MFDEELSIFPDWLRKVVVAAGYYNIIWGILVIAFPFTVFRNLNIPVPPHIFPWQVIGGMTAFFGLAYLVAARDILRFWPIIFIGFLAKIIIPIGFLIGWMNGSLPGNFGFIILFNDIIWLIPFGMILHKLYDTFIREDKLLEEEYFLEEEFNMVETNKGKFLKDLSDERPVVLVFLRHFGCTFCREMLSELSKNKNLLDRNSKELVIVHMSDYERAEKLLEKYELQDVHQISDVSRDIYRYFGLRRGYISELVGIREWTRGFISSVIKRNGMGTLEGDLFQLSGVFVYYKGKIRGKYIHRSAGDLPDFKEIAHCKIA